MSITRKDIKAILPDIDDDAMKNLMALIHTETDTLKDEKDDIQKQLEKANSDLKDANTAKEKAESDFSAYKAEIAGKETKSKKESAYRALLKEANVSDKFIPLILKGTDLSGFELDDDGKFKEASKLTESIKQEHADFIGKVKTSGANVGNPPAGGKVGKYSTKEEIYAIKDTSERQKAILENSELFGI